MNLFAAFLLLCTVLSTVQGQCTPYGSLCYSGDTCCSGQCTAVNNAFGLPGSCTCTSAGGSCSSNGACCSNSCSDLGVCQTGMGTCNVDRDCKSDKCVNGQCQCVGDGNRCMGFGAAACCSGSCNGDGICGGGCIAPGNIGCLTDLGCCGNRVTLLSTSCVAGKCCKLDTQHVDCPNTDSNGYAANPLCCSGVCKTYTFEGTPTSSCVTSLPIG